MSGNERFDSKAGPFGGLPQGYLSGLENMVKGYEPALKGASRWNLEVMGLLTKRTRAWLGVSAQFSHCKSPMDLVSEQMRFWQTAASDYTEASQRLAAAARAVAVLPALGGTQPRDYIAVPDAPEAAAAPKRSDRKAA